MDVASTVSPTQALAERLADMAASFAVITTHADLASVTEQAVQSFIPVEINGLYLWDDEAGRLRLHYATGLTTEERADAERTAMARHPGEVFRSRKLLHIADVQDDPSPRPQWSQRRVDVRSRLFMPVMYGEHVVGVFGLAGSQPNSFSDEHVSVLRFVCQLVAVANRRLLDAAERGRAESLARRRLQAAHDALESRVIKKAVDLTSREVSVADVLAELHRVQERLIQAEKMASLGLLVAGIAHEIKNPLNFINNFAELSLEFATEIEEQLVALIGSAPGDALAELIPEVANNLRRIHEHGRRADAIINAMLMHAREQSGDLQIGDLNELVHTHAALAYAGFRSVDQGFHVDLVEDLAPDLDAIPLAAPELSRVILNLVTNACHALRERQRRAEPHYRPSLRLSTRRVGASIVISVHDNGIGVPKESQRRIFDPFFTTKPPGEGTGLGLSICHDIIVHRLGGTIDVDSVPGEYSEFSLSLPAAPIRPTTPSSLES